MNKILALREKRANLWNETKAFLDSHREDIEAADGGHEHGLGLHAEG